MLEHVLVLALLAVVIISGAWRDHAAGNRRDARLLAGIGMCTGIGAVAVAVS